MAAARAGIATYALDTNTTQPVSALGWLLADHGDVEREVAAELADVVAVSDGAGSRRNHLRRLEEKLDRCVLGEQPYRDFIARRVGDRARTEGRSMFSDGYQSAQVVLR